MRSRIIFKTAVSRSGFTFLESMFVLAVIAVLLVISFGGYQKYRRRVSINTNTFETVSLLERARTLSVVSYNGGKYGVHFETDQYVLFTSPVYQPGASGNEVQKLAGFRFLEPLAFSNGQGGKTQNVIFSSRSGFTVNTGTIRLESVQDPAIYKNIIVNSLGVVRTQ